MSTKWSKIPTQFINETKRRFQSKYSAKTYVTQSEVHTLNGCVRWSEFIRWTWNGPFELHVYHGLNESFQNCSEWMRIVLYDSRHYNCVFTNQARLGNPSFASIYSYSFISNVIITILHFSSVWRCFWALQWKFLFPFNHTAPTRITTTTKQTFNNTNSYKISIGKIYCVQVMCSSHVSFELRKENQE